MFLAFEDCIHAYGNKSGKLRQFPLNRSVLLYVIIIYLQHQEKIPREEFIRRIRIVNNLIQNSEDEVSDRIDRNRIPAILKSVDVLMLTGRINETEEKNFNESQLREEMGRIVTMISSFMGIAIIALPSGIITAGYMDALGKSAETEETTNG